jgi:hypothetical protein
MQGRPDPVRVEPVGRDPIVVEWAGDTFIQARAINDDADGAKFAVSTGGIDEWFVEIVDAAGKPVPAISRFFLGQIACRHVVLSSQDAVDGGGGILEHADALALGEYRVRVLYHGSDAPGWPWRRDWLVMSASKEIPLTVVPRRITTDRDEQARVAAVFTVTMVEAPSALDDAAYEAWLASHRAASETLCEAGWRCVPMLLEVLEDGRTTPAARDWALGWLRTITGVGASVFDRLGDPKAQAAEVAQWRSWRRMLEIEVR